MVLELDMVYVAGVGYGVAGVGYGGSGVGYGVYGDGYGVAGAFKPSVIL